MIALVLPACTDEGKSLQANGQELVEPLDHKNTASIESIIQAANAGDRLAEYELGLSYARGSGVEKNFVLARQWLEKAAMQGHPRAMYHLGEMNVWGDGSETDYEEAIVWFWLGTSLGDKHAQRRLRAMTTRISTEDLADAKDRVNKMWEKIPHDMKSDSNLMSH
ncbi:MAG: tetratricopeptide repeat protein [Mariprofundaceae bacterium]